MLIGSKEDIMLLEGVRRVVVGGVGIRQPVAGAALFIASSVPNTPTIPARDEGKVQPLA